MTRVHSDKDEGLHLKQQEEMSVFIFLSFQLTKFLHGKSDSENLRERNVK